MMNKQFSLYLDLLRFAAAALVFISHASGVSGGLLWQIGGLGHEAVVFFFVLSGFVIAYVVYYKNESGKYYVIARLSRIYSVAIPALLLTLALYYIGMTMNEQAYPSLNGRLLDPVWTTVSALLFINQSWIGTPVFLNLPYWSLGYEVLYYVFFGILMFVSGPKKYFLLLAVLAIMGPSIILYLPIWLMGAWCFKHLTRFEPTALLSTFAYLCSVAGIIALCQPSLQGEINTMMTTFLGEAFYAQLLEPAEMFASDYLLGVFVTLHIYASYHLSHRLPSLHRTVETMIRNCSAHTFSLYLYHLPMMYFVALLAPYEHHPLINAACCFILVPVLIVLLSRYTEGKRPAYKVFFSRCLHKIPAVNKRSGDQDELSNRPHTSIG